MIFLLQLKGIDLLKQLENPVYWHDTIINMTKNNLTSFIEVGPGNVLSKLTKKIDSNLKTTNFNMINFTHD